MGDYRGLKVWERAHELTLEIYRATRSFPDTERFGLTSQLMRAAASIPANLAEGCGRNSQGELNRFCGISMGSARELEYHLLLAKDLGYLEEDSFTRLADRTDHVKRMLANLQDAILPTRRFLKDAPFLAENPGSRIR
jgi:four helix bundle protein